jgi:hypothetical protein
VKTIAAETEGGLGSNPVVHFPSGDILAHSRHHAREFVAGNNRGIYWNAVDIIMEDVKVGSANACGMHLDFYLPRTRLGFGYIPDFHIA